MIIQKIEIISFGKFKNKTIEFNQGLNIICGNNESGKSTIISFIYAMLYGFGDNRGKNASLREKYTPWDGGDCEGKMSVTLKSGENITIYRKAGETKKHDILRIYDSETAQPLSLTPEEIAGVSSDTFLKTLCVKQMSSAFLGTTDEIMQRLSNISSGGDETLNFEKALKILDNARREIRPLRGNGGELSAINSQIENLEHQRMLHSAMEKELENSLALLPQSEEYAMQSQKKYEDALKNDYSSNIAHLHGRIEEKEKQLFKEQAQYKKFKFNTKFSLLSAVCLLGGIISVFINTALCVMLFTACIILFLMNFILPQNTAQKSETQTEIESLKSQLSSMEKEKEMYDEKVSVLKANATSAQGKLNALKLKTESLSLKLSDSSSDNLDELYKKREQLENRLKALTLSTEALLNAHNKMQLNFTPVLNKKASSYFEALTGGKYSRIFSDEQFNLSIDIDIPRKSELFSGGTIDQLYLSLRMALADMLFEDNSCCIILDQPFLQYDLPRTQNALNLFQNMTNNRQILLFTSDCATFSDSKKIEILT